MPTSVTPILNSIIYFYQGRKLEIIGPFHEWFVISQKYYNFDEILITGERLISIQLDIHNGSINSFCDNICLKDWHYIGIRKDHHQFNLNGVSLVELSFELC